MDRLDIVLALIQEAKEEKRRLEAMEMEIAKIPKNLNPIDYCRFRYEIDDRYSPIPHKSIVNDNIKIARRLLALEYL